jgi:long-subunit fatty acid transport protein
LAGGGIEAELVARIHPDLRDVEGGMDIAFTDIVVDQDWRSSFGAAVGVEWEVLEDRLHLRLGLFYDSGAVPDHTLSVAWFDSHKIGLCVGLTVEVWRFAFDLGYSHLFFVPRTIEDSVMQQINPLEPPSETLPTTVANGRYESSIDVVGLTIRAQIDTARWGRGNRSEEEEPSGQSPQR